MEHIESEGYSEAQNGTWAHADNIANDALAHLACRESYLGDLCGSVVNFFEICDCAWK